VRQQLREWCDEAHATRVAPRQALVVEDGFMPLLGWVLGHWQGTQLALALDATTLGLRFTVLAVSVVSRGCAIPVAWTILPAHQPAAWRDPWLRLLRQLRPAIPKGHTDIVLADRMPLAVSAPRPVGLVPMSTPQSRRHLPARPAGHRPPVERLCALAWHALARHWHGLQEPPAATAVHAAGLLGSRRHRAVVDPDRLAT
jgi:hypothetical protein